MTRFWFVLALYAVNILAGHDLFATLLTLPLFWIVSYNLIKIKSEYLTKWDVLWFTIFLFFVIAPCQTMHDGTIIGEDAVTRYTYSDREYITAMSIVVAFTLAFTIGSRISFRQSGPPCVNGRPGLGVHSLTVITGLSFVAFVALAGGIANVLAPRLEKDTAAMNVTWLLAVAVQMVAATMIAASCRGKGKLDFSRVPYLGLAVGLLMISQNPFNSPRFFLLAAWAPLGLALAKGKLRAGAFYWLSLAGLVVLMPVLNVTTRFGMGASAADAVSPDALLQFPFVGGFDTLVHCVHYMATSTHMDGAKVVAILTFFVPRNLWPAKPIVGGLDIGNDLYRAKMAGTPNLAFFVGGDLYMDFGFLGVFAGGLLCGYLFCRANPGRLSWYCGQDVFEYILLANLPILVRGPVGAVIQLFSCQVFAFVVLQGAMIPLTRLHAYTGYGHRAGRQQVGLAAPSGTALTGLRADWGGGRYAGDDADD